MATPEANLATSRGPGDMNGNHNSHPSSARHLHNFNTFQFVSQLVSATPPYLFNMSTPFPGNFFSDLLRRMAPRAGAHGLPQDINLQQHIRAALLSKGAQPTLPPHSVLPPPLDLAALAAQQRHHQPIGSPSSSQDKADKRSLFADVSSLSSCEDEAVIKKPRLEDTREDRNHSDGLASAFLMQTPFLTSAVPAHPDIMTPWSARALLRPQLPIAPPVPPGLDPYRLLLDLRLAGQLRSMAATQALPMPHIPSMPSISRASLRETSRSLKDELPTPSFSTTLRGDDSRVSAFHPPGRTVPADTSDDDSSDTRHTRNSYDNKGTIGPQYILKNLTEIYRIIDLHRNDDNESGSKEESKSKFLNASSRLPLSFELVKPYPTDTTLKQLRDEWDNKDISPKQGPTSKTDNFHQSKLHMHEPETVKREDQ